MRFVVVSAVLVACLLLGRVSCQLDCGLPTQSDIENVIASVLTSGDSIALATVNVTNFREVCRASSEERNRYRGVSVVVEYTCEGNANCPTGTVTEQFETSCVNGDWSNEVLNSPDNTRTQSPTATFSTILREDCAFCLSPALASSVGIPAANAPDADNHCVACNSACNSACNVGLMQCYGLSSIQCCPYYNEDMCVTDCPGVLEPDDDFDCNCTGFFLDPPNCQECGLQCENGGTPELMVCAECSCPVGFTNYNCSEDIDECMDSPCQNGGTCVNTVGSFTCECVGGFTGEVCDEDIDECTTNSPCQNGGTCINTVGSFTCECFEGFTGEICNEDIDECENSDCENGATCVNTIGSYTCVCASGFTGSLCDIDIDECMDSPCLNGGTCTNTPGSFTCSCAPDFTGSLCGDEFQDLSCQSVGSSQLKDVLSDIIQSGDDIQMPVINLTEFCIVCQAFGQQQYFLHFVSVVVQYACTGNANCPLGTVVEQIEAGCADGQWSNDVLGSTENTHSVTTEASFTTTAREDCSFCLSPERVSTFGITTDPVTHCVACNSSCDEGLMRCYGFGSGQCCNFYNNSVCVDECPDPFVSNSDNVCDCPVGRFGHNCEEIVVCSDLGTLENGMVTFSDTTFDSVATYSCDAGYTLTGDAMRRCHGDGTWSGNIPTCTETCEQVDCGCNWRAIITAHLWGRKQEL